MRKNFLVAVSLLLCVVMLSFVNTKPVVFAEETKVSKQTEIMTVANNYSVVDKALETRFLNMLNHNFVYNEDFSSDEALINNSILALLDLSVDSYIEMQYVNDYIYNMYGIENFNYGSIDKELTEKAGYVYVIPRGYSLYQHKIVSVTANMDGSYTVVTDVEISMEDDSVLNERATTLFLPNGESRFGFNILYSDISFMTNITSAC